MMEEQRFYGRKREAESLETILHSVLKENIAGTAATTVSNDPLTSHRPLAGGDDIVPNRQRNCHLVLVSGAAGSGKRTFARSVLQQNLDSCNGSPFLLAVGRFRHSHRRKNSGTETSKVVDDRPFSAINEAIQEILNMVTSENSNEALTAIRLRLHQMSSDDVEVLTCTFPSMKRWLPPMAASIKASETDLTDFSETSKAKMSLVKPEELGSHFVAHQPQVLSPVLIRCLEAVLASAPLVLLLEDMHYADESSLRLVESLMNQNERSSSIESLFNSKGLLIVATTQEEDELSGLDKFKSFWKRCQKKKDLLGSPASLSNLSNAAECSPTTLPTLHRCFHHILLSGLTWEDTFEWVQASSDGMFARFSKQHQREITDVAFHHSNGNVLRLRYCLLFLARDGKIFHEGESIHKNPIPKSINEMYAAILSCQDFKVKNVVRTAAALMQFCEGNVDLSVLEVAVGVPCVDTIIVAHDRGLLEYEFSREYVRFLHGELQNVVYDAIPCSDRALLHLDIGRRIWRSTLEEEKDACDDKHIGKVVIATLQLRNSIHLLVDFDERLYMAQLCFETGQKCAKSGDFYPASKLFEFSLFVLGPALWNSDLYETSLVLHNAAAQAYYSIGDLKKMEETMDSIFDNTTTFRDKLAAYVILVYATGTKLKLLEAFRTACFVLGELGEPINRSPSTLTVVTHLIGTKTVLLGKNDSFFRNLPITDDADYIVLMQLLNFAMFVAYTVKAEAGILLCFRIIRLSMKNGINGPFLSCLASYGFLLSAMGSFEEGNRYGMLSLELVQKFDAWRPRVQMPLFGYIYYWMHPFRDCWEPLLEAQRSAFKHGDLGTYAGCSSYYLLVQLSMGSSLRELEPYGRSLCCSLDLFGQSNPLLLALPIWGFISDLLAITEPLAVSREVKDGATALIYAVKEENKYVVGNIYMLRTMWYYLVGEYSEALQMAKKSVEYRQISDHSVTFYEALAALAMAGSSRRLTRRKHRNRARMLTKRMKGWARRCPENFLNKQLLLEAELAALNGNTRQVVSLFEQSIDKAKQEGFCHEEGIAYERLGHYQRSLGQVSNATMSFESARVAFENWGAIALVKRIDTLLASM